MNAGFDVIKTLHLIGVRVVFLPPVAVRPLFQLYVFLIPLVNAVGGAFVLGWLAALAVGAAVAGAVLDGELALAACCAPSDVVLGIGAA